MNDDKDKIESIIKQVRRDRGIRRKLQYELDLPQIKHTIEKSHKKDKAEKKRNTVKPDEWDE